MKKAVIVHHVGGLGGGTISLIDIAVMLSSEYEVTVILPENSMELTKRLQKEKIIVKHYKGIFPQFSYYSGSNPIISRGFATSFFVSKKSINNLVDLIIAQKPDLLIANSVIQFRIGKYLKDYSFKKFIYIRETFKENFISKYMIKKINKYFDGVLCIAPYEKKYANFKIPCIVVADCCKPFVNSSNIRIKDINKNNFNVLYMGGTAPLKGFDTFVNCLPHIKNSNVKFIVAGLIDFNVPKSFVSNIIYRKLYRNLEKNKKIISEYKENVKMLGFVDNIDELFQCVDLVIFPSTLPHQPRPAIEAGMFRLPVVISDFVQTKDYFINEYNCLTFKSNNCKDLATKIEMIASDRNLYEKLAENNYNITQKYHNWECENTKICNFLKENIKN